MTRLLSFLAAGLAGIAPAVSAGLCDAYSYADNLAGGPQYADTLAGLEGLGLADDPSDEQVARAMAGLSAEELGRRHRRQGQAHMQVQNIGVQRMPLAAMVPAVHGAPRVGLRKVPLPIGATSFTATSGTSLTLTTRTQRPYRPTRMIIVVNRTGATATGLITVSEIKVGQDPQPAAAGSMPAEGFGPQVWDADVDFTPITPGIDASVTFGNSVVPTAPDKIDVSAMFVGFSVQS